MKAKPAKANKTVKPAPRGAPKATKAPAAKVAVKKPAAKKAAKPALKKPLVKKPPAKSAVPKAGKAKPVNSTKKPGLAAKAARPATAKAKVPAAKPVPSARSKPTRSDPLTATKTNTQAKPAPVATPKSSPAPSAPPAMTPVPPATSAPPVAQRTGRPSSRLASLTVPSMAQSIASTAAKASYSQVAAAPLIIPPLPSAAKKDPKLANNWKTKPAEQLSDAELLAMPDDEYMNEKQLAAFRLKLVTLKQDILNSAGETTEHLREDTVVVPDPADRATIEEEHALELRTRDRERKLLKKIEQSIDRIDSGDYGYCDETGESIGVGRLLARPTATLSLEAQQRRELKQKMFGD